MRRLLLAFALLTACATDTPSPTDAALPECDDLPGCEHALCTITGVCTCLRSGEPPVECHRG